MSNTSNNAQIFEQVMKFNTLVGPFNICSRNIGVFLMRSFGLCCNVSVAENLGVKRNKCSGMINWKGFSLQGGDKLKPRVKTA